MATAFRSFRGLPPFTRWPSFARSATLNEWAVTGYLAVQPVDRLRRWTIGTNPSHRRPGERSQVQSLPVALSGYCSSVGRALSGKANKSCRRGSSELPKAGNPRKQGRGANKPLPKWDQVKINILGVCPDDGWLSSKVALQPHRGAVCRCLRKNRLPHQVWYHRLRANDRVRRNPGQPITAPLKQPAEGRECSTLLLLLQWFDGGTDESTLPGMRR